MRLLKEFDQRNTDEIGMELHSFAAELYPICRSITGDGIRQTLGVIQKRIAMETTEVPTGTTVLDWTVPKEWNIRDAYIKDAKGNRVVDFLQCNLDVLNYSAASTRQCPSANSSHICSRSPNIRSGFRTGPHTTRRTGDSVCLTVRCWPWRMATTKCASIPP